MSIIGKFSHQDEPLGYKETEIASDALGASQDHNGLLLVRDSTGRQVPAAPVKETGGWVDNDRPSPNGEEDLPGGQPESGLPPGTRGPGRPGQNGPRGRFWR